MRTFLAHTILVGLLACTAVSSADAGPWGTTRRSSRVTPSPRPAPARSFAAENRALALINAHRRAHGLRLLRADDRLAAVARAHAYDMARRGYFSHADRRGQSPFDRMARGGIRYRAAAENLAVASTTDQAVAAWMDSHGHRANILGRRFTHTGIGMARSTSGRLYIVQLFADY